MANELRVRSNFQSGTITDNPLTNVATTINSAAFANLPVIDTTNHMILILDPLASAGAPEIVKVTAHTASATSVTVVRGQEGTTARQHAQGMVWRHSPTVLDYPTICTSTTRPSVGLYPGMEIYETDTSRPMVYNGLLWQMVNNPPSCRIFHNTTQSIANNTETVVAFNSERWDGSNMHDPVTNNSRITFNIAGVYTLGFNGFFTPSATDFTSVYCYVRLNGLTNLGYFQNMPTTTSNGGIMALSTTYRFVAGDYVEILVYQLNGAATARNLASSANASPEAYATWIGIG